MCCFPDHLLQDGSEECFTPINLSFSTRSCSLIKVCSQLLINGCVHEHYEERKIAIHKVGLNSLFCREAVVYLNSPSNVVQKQYDSSYHHPSLYMHLGVCKALISIARNAPNYQGFFLSSSVINLSILSFTTTPKSEMGCWSSAAKVCVYLRSKHPGYYFCDYSKSLSALLQVVCWERVDTNMNRLLNVGL